MSSESINYLSKQSNDKICNSIYMANDFFAMEGGVVFMGAENTYGYGPVDTFSGVVEAKAMSAMAFMRFSNTLPEITCNKDVKEYLEFYRNQILPILIKQTVCLKKMEKTLDGWKYGRTLTIIEKNEKMLRNIQNSTKNIDKMTTEKLYENARNMCEFLVNCPSFQETITDFKNFSDLSAQANDYLHRYFRELNEFCVAEGGMVFVIDIHDEFYYLPITNFETMEDANTVSAAILYCFMDQLPIIEISGKDVKEYLTFFKEKVVPIVEMQITCVRRILENTRGLTLRKIRWILDKQNAILENIEKAMENMENITEKQLRQKTKDFCEFLVSLDFANV